MPKTKEALGDTQQHAQECTQQYTQRTGQCGYYVFVLARAERGFTEVRACEAEASCKEERSGFLGYGPRASRVSMVFDSAYSGS